MGRAPCCDKASVRKGPWSPEEDAKLKEYMQRHDSCGNWIALPQKAGLRRCGKSCRLRWLNYLRPNIKHGEFTDDEDRLICSLFAHIGSRWSVIAGQLPGRTDNDIKNYWNTKLKKKLLGSMPHKRPLHSSKSKLSNLNSQIPLPYDQSCNTSSFSAFSTAVEPATSNSFISSSFTAPSVPMNGNYNHNNQTGQSLGFESCFSNGVADNSNRFLITATETKGNDQKGEKGKCLGHENSLDYSMEDIKQLISTSHVTTNLNFFVDEIKTEGTLYY